VWTPAEMTEAQQRSSEPWPLHHVQTALWFLSSDTADQAKYLPAPFPAIQFHGSTGDFVTGNPLYFMVQLCADACAEGARLDEWGDLDPNGVIGPRFVELRAILSAMHGLGLEDNDPVAFMRSPESYPDLRGLFSAARRYARGIVADLSWNAELSRHTFSCVELLDEYSYGAYSARVAAPPQAD
jgi:hypothetical protein